MTDAPNRSPAGNRARAKPSFDAVLGLGSNEGDKAQNLREALRLLTATGDISLVAVSPFYRTAPWGVLDQDWFVNACATVTTSLDARTLLRRCLDVEARMKRVRVQRWGPRVIDVDVLVYRDEVSSDDELTLPHPRITQRGFVLVPLADVAPGLIIGGKTIKAWCEVVVSPDVVPL